MPKLENVLKQLGFKERSCAVETADNYVFLNPKADVGRFCYDTDEAPVLPIAIIRKRRGRGTRAILVVTNSKTYLRMGGLVEEDRQKLIDAGCRFVDHQSLEKRSAAA